MTSQAGTLRQGSLAVLLAIAGCATQQAQAPSATGDASWRMTMPAGTIHYKLAIGDVATGANVFRRVTPIYPRDELAACPPPQEVQALLIVDQAGKVGEVRVADEATADANRRSFIASVRAAALQWSFNPLQVQHWAADADGNSHVVDVETRPFSWTYVFRFECHAGRAAVSNGTVVGSRP